VFAVGVVVPDVLFGGRGGDAELVVAGLAGLLPEGVGVFDPVPQPAGAALADEELAAVAGRTGQCVRAVGCPKLNAVFAAACRPAGDLGQVPLGNETERAARVVQ